MNVTIKVLLVWLMLLAVPLQGFASASALLCAPAAAPHAPVASAHASPAAMSGAVHTAAHDQALGHHHSHEKCGASANCCSGASMIPSFVPALPSSATRFVAAAPAVRLLASADPDLPDRPPRA